MESWVAFTFGIFYLSAETFYFNIYFERVHDFSFKLLIKTILKSFLDNSIICVILVLKSANCLFP